MKSSLLALGALAAGVLAAPAPINYVVHERREVMPRSWSEGIRLHGKTVLPIRIGLTQSNLDRAHELLMEVSDHTSPKYGQWYTAEEVRDLFAPAEDTVQAVRDWLESAGVAPDRITLSANKQWLQFDAEAEEVESLLRTEYHVYEDSGTGKTYVACQEYSIPEHIQEHIDYITPGIKHIAAVGARPANDADLKNLKKRFSIPNPLPPVLKSLPVSLETIMGSALETCGVAITPACIKALYNITDGTKATPGNELGIFEDLGDVYSQEDLDLFFATFANEIPQGTHPIHNLIDGAQAPAPVTGAGPESNLDFQISYPLIWPQNSVLFQTDDPVYQANYTFVGFLNNFLDAIDGSYCSYSAYGETGNSPIDPPYPNPGPGGYKGQLMCGVYKPTPVISISYGAAEADLPISYQRRQCNEFMKLGMQGVTIFVASGDSGVEGRGGNPRPSNCLGTDDKVFAPDFPATCPYLTAVGATTLPPLADPSKLGQEEAVKSFGSGGGFSNIYERPSYQNDAVEGYFATVNPLYPYYESVDNSSFAENGGIYNRIGRAYPDVSAIGDNIVVFTGGSPALIGGTSAAAPLWGAIITRINEERIAAGKTTVGFINPVLYKHPEVFNDVTVGNNSGCGTPGFYAAKGWDPVTGLGTPNYPKLLDLFMNL